MKRCVSCGLDKDEAEFHWLNKRRNHRNPECSDCMAVGRWPAASYKQVQKFSRDEEYIINKLAAKPTLSAALDALYRRNPRRWHQVVVASTLVRKERVANS